MKKRSSKSQQHSKSPKRSNSKNHVTPSKRRGMTKHDRVLGLLRTKRGTTIAAISKVTGWQPHSVRAFLRGLLKKKLGLTLTSEKTKSGRIYRILVAKPSTSSRSVAQQQERNDE
jgi:hypothetical protein